MATAVDEALLAHESEHAQHDVVQRRIALAEARKETPGIGTARLELPNEVTVNLGTHRLGGGHQKLKRARAPPASPRPGGHRARAETIRALARRVVDGSIALGPGIEGRAAIAALKTVRGIGDWTAEYIAMRAYGDRDAFPSGDLVLRRAAGNISARDLNRRSDAWRPWRAYAVMLLWQHTNDECHTGARGAVEGRCIAD